MTVFSQEQTASTRALSLWAFNYDIPLRRLGRCNFSESDLPRSDFAAHDYANGVPMGADLAAAPEGKAPSFLVCALRDPDGANLDRVQVVKGWQNADGSAGEQVYDVAWSGDRVPKFFGVNVPEGAESWTTERAYTSPIWYTPAN